MIIPRFIASDGIVLLEIDENQAAKISDIIYYDIMQKDRMINEKTKKDVMISEKTTKDRTIKDRTIKEGTIGEAHLKNDGCDGFRIDVVRDYSGKDRVLCIQGAYKSQQK